MKNVEKRIEVIKAQLAIAHNLQKITEGFVGKQVNKRIQTVAREQMGTEFAVVYSKSDWGSWEVKVWGNGLAYENMFTLYMGANTGYDELLKNIDNRIIGLKEEMKELEKYTAKDVEQFIAFAKTIQENIKVLENLPYSVRASIKEEVGHISF